MISHLPNVLLEWALKGSKSVRTTANFRFESLSFRPVSQSIEFQRDQIVILQGFRSRNADCNKLRVAFRKRPIWVTF